ncbi:MAG: calcium/sodium antiporter [Eubacteriales bacterium]|nr:calcium/sodium antiporter [Eubacteriales bacterium]
MLVPVLLFLAGLIIICIGGDKFVDNAVIVAKHLGMSEIMVGATIVSIGTTLPEVLVSTTAAFDGSAAICAGNAYGSVICNTALIAGISQLCRPAAGVDKRSFRWNVSLFFMFSVFLFAVQYFSGRISRSTGVILLIGFVAYTLGYINIAKSQPTAEETKDKETTSLACALLLMLLFAAALFVGAKLLVNNGIIIAQALGVPERVIAVTFIALGTSLPELVTTITSLTKGYASLGLGNVLGANLLNLLLVIGIPAVITSFPVERATTFIDVPISIIVMLVLTVPVMIKKRGFRLQGLALVLIYAGYCIYSFL